MSCRNLLLAFAVVVGVAPSVALGQGPSHTLSIDSASAMVSDDVSLPIRLEVAAGASPIAAFSVSILNPDDTLSPVTLEVGPALQSLNGGNGPDFLRSNSHASPGATGFSFAAVFSALGQGTLLAGSHHVLTSHWTIGPSAIGTSAVSFCDCLGNPPVHSLVVDVTATDFVPGLDSATVTILTGTPFQRGDCNSDGAKNLADPIRLLNLLFPPMVPVALPQCSSSCDANDDGLINLADAVAMLSVLFPIGAPLGWLPPDLCGVDATQDALTCDAYPPCP